MDRRLDGRTVGWMDARMDGWFDGLIDKLTNEWRNWLCFGWLNPVY